MDIRRLIPYKAPSFVPEKIASLHAPSHRVALGNTPTPIHSWSPPGVPSDFSLSIKRDDLTGVTLSGNKTRKLEFILARALALGCTSVITCGALTSNHARTTAIAARQLGLQPHLVLRSPNPSVTKTGAQGNMLLNKMVGANITVVPRMPYLTGLLPIMQDIAAKQYENKALLVPIGGSDLTGMWGYVECWREMEHQNEDLEPADGQISFRFADVTDIVITIGSGGSTAGLVLANYFTGCKKKIHAVAVCDDAQYFHGHVNEMIQQLGLTEQVTSEQILDVIEGHKGPGYGLQTDEGYQFIVDCATTTGIVLDPCYTGKGAFGMIAEFQKNPDRFQGKNILFVHTGGVFGLYDSDIQHYMG